MLGEHENYLFDLHGYIKIDSAKHDKKLYLHGPGQGAGGATDLVGPTDGGFGLGGTDQRHHSRISENAIGMIEASF